MTTKTTVHHDPSDSRARMPILIAVLMLIASMMFIGSALTGPAQAQGEHGAIPSITLDSNQPGQLVITWETPDPAPTDYRIMWANTNLGFPSYKNPNEAERANEYPLADVTTLTLNNLTPGDSYKVKIRSRYYNADRSVHKSSGPWTNLATQRVKDHPPATPTGLTTSSMEHDSVTLGWNDPQDGNITGYRVLRGTSAASLSALEDNTESAGTEYTDSTVEPETTYHYAVIAMSTDGNSAQSSAISATTPAEPESEEQTVQNDPPAAPTGLTAARIGHSVLTLTWDNPEDDSITGYQVLRGASATSLSTLENDTESVSTRYEDETVEPETTYHYAVVALSANGDSPQSSAISATTPAAPKSKDPPPPRVGPRQSITTTEVTADWGLKPTDVAAGSQFRLIFLSSTKRNASPTTISNYNIFVQGRAAAGHTDIRTHSSGFKAVVCTEAVDARDNTSTTGTGVPIYWLNGTKVADSYADFYDGSWDDEANDKNESGTNGPDTSQTTNYPFTGCEHNGTEESSFGSSHALGASQVIVGRPNSSGSGHGPIYSSAQVTKGLSRPMYGLSAVFQVAGAANTPAAGAPAITAPNVFRVPAVLGVDLSGITDTDGVTNIAGNATYKWQRFNAAGTTLETDSIGTDATYTLTDTDATKTLKVVVNFTDDATNSEGPLTSAATSAITAAATDCAPPTYVGGATEIWTAKLTIEKFVINTTTVYGFSDTEGKGNLDNVTFTTDASNNYEVQGLSASAFGTGITTTTLLASVDKSTLVLHICDQAYAFAPLTNPSSTPALYAFTMPLQNWSTHAERTIYLSQDTAAPTFTSATVNGSTLVVTLSEDLGAAANLPNSAFTVKKGSSGTTQTLSGTPSISGSTVTLTLATAVTATDTAVKVAYAKPTSGSANKPVDKFGNETATFTDQGVTNNTNATNTAPTVANAIPDQEATVDTAFSYTFLANTFNDVDVTDTLTYTATKADGALLPTWLTFTDTTRTFSGAPTAAGTVSVKVTASDGTASVSDEFDIVVSAAPMPLAVTQREDRRYAFTESDFSNLPGGRVTLTKVIITELPNNGWLARSKTVLLPSGNRQSQSERIHSGHLPLTFSTDNRRLSLAFFPEANGNGTPYASFKFKVNSSTDEHTMQINVTPVNDPAYGRVFITGPAQVGYELTAFTSSIGDRDGIPRDQLNYQWKRYAADGTTFEANIGANSSTYRVTDNDVGKKIKLEVRFTDNDGTDEGPLTSPAFPYIATQTVGEATFISTIGMVGDSYRSFTTQEQGQVFTTGGNPNGYTVTSVVIISEDSAGDDVALKICGVDESLHPTAVCTDLTAPMTSPAGPLVFTAPPGTMLAGGRTNYMVVFSSPGDDNVRLDTHYSDGYDSNSLAGFSIRNRIHYKTGTGWQEISYRRGFRIAVLGTINP